MYKKSIGGTPLWQFDSFSGFDHLKHFVSGRGGGVSNGEKSSLNLSYHVGDDPGNVDENRSRVAKSMGISINNLIFPQQIHSNKVQVISKATLNTSLEGADALITNQPGVCIAVLAADCVPILLYDPKKKAVGAVHSGWRGTVAHILTETIKAMEKNFDSDTADLIVGIGPSISPMVYEVDEPVIAAVKEAYPQVASELLCPQQEKGKALFNLWEANKYQLTQLNIPEENIEIAGICTLTDSDQFFSARASAASGRFATGILLRED